MSTFEQLQDALSKYHLKLEDGNLVPNTRYYLREVDVYCILVQLEVC